MTFTFSPLKYFILLKYEIRTVFPHIGNYSFLNLEFQRSLYIRPKVTVHKCAETIWGNTVIWFPENFLNFVLDINQASLGLQQRYIRPNRHFFPLKAEPQGKFDLNVSLEPWPLERTYSTFFYVFNLYTRVHLRLNLLVAFSQEIQFYHIFFRKIILTETSILETSKERESKYLAFSGASRGQLPPPPVLRSYWRPWIL